MTTRFYLVLALLTVVQNVINNDFPTITTDQGTLRGTKLSTLKGREILAFQGIPYAEAPIGEKRFKPPIPLKAWDGILDATKNHNHCPQDDVLFRLYGIHGNEDCLFLNVYTPKITNELFPVIVFIHGGGFMFGNANLKLYQPNTLLDRDLVLVTVNYRLGALGFLSTEDQVVPGNNGLKDQSLALKWVKDNIKNFGGNPKKITVFGHSAGATSAYLHLLSPLSKNILFGAISSSGTLAPWSLAQNGEAINNAKRLANYLSCPTISNEEMVNCLRKAEAFDIIRQSNKFSEFNYEPSIPFKPVVEVENVGAFMPQNPIELVKKGNIANVSLLTCVTTDEGAMKAAGIFNDSNLVERLNTHFDKYLPMILNYDAIFRNKNTNKFSESIKRFYLGENKMIDSSKSALTDIVTDGLFFYPARSISVLHAKYSIKPVYFYLFGYRGSNSLSSSFGDPNHDYGVCHGDDMIYVLKSYTSKLTTNDKKMIDLMTKIWFNFASTGNPTSKSDATLVEWDPVSSDNLEYLAVYNHDRVKMQKNLFEERFQFWKNLEVPDYTTQIKNEV